MKARQVEVPPAIAALNPLSDPSYTYACELIVPAGDGRCAEQWARAVFEGAPRPLRWFVVAGWIVGLGLRLGPRPSLSHVLGWEILSCTPELIVLGAESFALSSRLVVRVEDSRVVHATFVHYQRRLARILWAAAEPIHRRVIPYLLGYASREAG